jgi:hypothetical protein
MKKLLPLAAMLAVPAHAQDAQVYYASDTWPVRTTGGTCTMAMAAPSTDGTLSVSYDGAQVTLASTSELESELPSAGKVNFNIVFLNNGRTDFDDGWGSREFAYSRENGAYRFATRFSGENNVRQILDDLAASKTLGLLQRGQTVVAYDLADAARSVARLRDCAGRQIAAN